MPLVWQRDPNIRLSIIGSGITEEDRSIASDRLTVVGWVPDITKALHAFRLTVAPLRYGAGLKGKVLDSMAAGLPTVMTPIAAEGMDLAPPLDQLVAVAPDALAGLIVSLHNDADRNRLLAEAGLQHVSRHYSPDVIDRLLQQVAGGCGS